jgi:transcriptional regulator with XRE-family HTH domain
MAEIIDNLKVGVFIKELLKEHRMTQDDLANELHITKAAVSQNLNGKNSFDIENLVRIAKLFKISLDDLIAARKPIDQPDIDSEYIRMMKRGFEDFKQHQPKALNIGIPDVYGKLFMEYLIENARHEWIEYIVDQGIIYADLNHQSYSVLSQKLVIYLLKNKLKYSEKIVESFAHKFGQFMFDRTHDREEFMVLLSQNQSHELFEKLLVGNIKFMTTKSLLFFNFKWTDLNPIYSRKVLIEDVIRYRLFDLWKIIVNLIIKHQAFAYNEKYFLMLSEAKFLEGLNYFIQTIPAANRLETYGSVTVS